MIYIIFCSGISSFWNFCYFMKKLAFQNRNSRGRHFGASRNNLFKVFYTCRKPFAFCRIFYSHDFLSQESFCLKLLLKNNDHVIIDTILNLTNTQNIFFSKI